jgi:hypothetical protein
VKESTCWLSSAPILIASACNLMLDNTSYSCRRRNQPDLIYSTDKQSTGHYELRILHAVGEVRHVCIYQMPCWAKHDVHVLPQACLIMCHHDLTGLRQPCRANWPPGSRKQKKKNKR